MHTEWADLEPKHETSRGWFAIEVTVAAIPVVLGIFHLTSFAMAILMGH